MNEAEIVERIRGLFPNAIIDVAGEDCSFEVYVVADEFSGQNTLQRQKPILALFKQEIGSGTLHALTIKAKTPEEQSSQSGLVQLSVNPK